MASMVVANRQFSNRVQPESLPREVRSGKAQRGEVAVVLPDSGIDLEHHIEELRRRYMIEALDRTGGVQTRAAEMLGMTFRSFRYFAKKYTLTGRDGAAVAAVERPAPEGVLGEGEGSEPGDTPRHVAEEQATAGDRN